MIVNRPELITNSSTDLDTTANTTASSKGDEDEEEAESNVQSPTTSTKKYNKSDLISPSSSPTQVSYRRLVIDTFHKIKFHWLVSFHSDPCAH